MDEVIVGIGIHEGKHGFIPVEKRVEMIRRLYADEPRVKVEAYSGLTVDFAREQGAAFMLRGIRSVKDFEYERDLADLNLRIGGVDTLLLISEPEYAAISSSVARELMSYGKDISKLLP